MTVVVVVVVVAFLPSFLPPSFLPCVLAFFLPSFLRFVRFKKKKGIKVFLGKPKEMARNPSMLIS